MDTENRPNEEPKKRRKRGTPMRKAWERPSKVGQKDTTYSLSRGWEDAMLQLYSEGATDSEVRKMLRSYRERGTLSQSLWDRWRKEEERFEAVVEVGHDLAQAWWMEVARKNICKSPFQVPLWISIVCNRFGWRQRTDLHVEDTDSKKQAREFMKKYNEALKKADNEQIDEKIVKFGGAH